MSEINTSIMYYCHHLRVLYLEKTRSSAVAERPRDASCLSVVGFNSTIPRTRSLIISYFGIRSTNAYNYILFCSLWRNVKVLCHKQDSLMRGAASFVSRDQQTSSHCYNLYTTVEMLTTGAVQQWSMPKPDIGRKLSFFPSKGDLRRNTAIMFGMEKLEWCGYPIVKKIVQIRLFVSTEYTNVTDRHADRHRMTE